jgi:hypothetical protein
LDVRSGCEAHPPIDVGPDRVVRETIPNVADDAVTSLLLGYSQLLGILLSLSFTEFLFHWLNSNTPSTDQPENEFS